MKTPVLFLIFNRVDVTQRVFEEIRKAKPPKLFVAADGPRMDSGEDAIKCEKTRAIIKGVDWKCEVHTLFRDQNLGCRVAVSSAINWFFEQVEEGIVLEDDCLPHPDFFQFCELLLEKYRDDLSVMHISGDNFQQGLVRGDASYYFSRIAHIWGWASWRRAWERYDVDMKDFPEFLRVRPQFFLNRSLEKYWLDHFRRVYKGADTWDFQWSYAVMKSRGFCAMPNVNLISNIGFGNQGTHALDNTNPLSELPISSIGEITHPSTIQFEDEADRYTLEEFPVPSIWSRIIAKIIRTSKKLLT